MFAVKDFGKINYATFLKLQGKKEVKSEIKKTCKIRVLSLTPTTEKKKKLVVKKIEKPTPAPRPAWTLKKAVKSLSDNELKSMLKIAKNKKKMAIKKRMLDSVADRMKAVVKDTPHLKGVEFPNIAKIIGEDRVKNPFKYLFDFDKYMWNQNGARGVRQYAPPPHTTPFEGKIVAKYQPTLSRSGRVVQFKNAEVEASLSNGRKSYVFA